MCIASPIRTWLHSVRRSQVTFVGLALFAFWLVSGCDRQSLPAGPRAAGTFSGAAADGRTLTIGLAQSGNTLFGRGRWGDDRLGLSAITALQGDAVFTMDDGAVRSGHITLSPDGSKVTLHGLGEPVTLKRGGTLAAETRGPFAGRYVARQPNAVDLNLEQSGNLLAGTGLYQGAPVAVTGKITGPNQARGTLLFSDESQSGVTVTLSDDRRVLHVSGLGGVLDLERR